MLFHYFSEGIEEPTNVAKVMKMEDGGKGDGGKGEAFQLTQQQQWLIQEDSPNQKLWDEVLASLKEGPVRFLRVTHILHFNLSCSDKKGSICITHLLK